MLAFTLVISHVCIFRFHADLHVVVRHALDGDGTCVMAFGDGPGAVGYLVGDENRGLEYMFIMMNSARFAVGLEGIGLAECAYQKARNYARERVQGVEQGGETSAKVAIIRHPDVRRMLLSMKSRIEAMRALSAVMAASMDQAALNPDPEVREHNQCLVL